MLGTTNAIVTDTCGDPHTVFLLNKPDLLDHSKSHYGLFFSSNPPYTSNTVIRDGRASIYFDTGTYMGVHQPTFVNSSHPWTIETWFYGLGDTTSALAWIVVSGNWYGLLWGYGQSARYMFLSNNGADWNLLGSTECTNKGTIYNTWQHRALVWTGTALLCFTDGHLTNTINLNSSWTFGGNFFIGYYYSNNFLYGCIQDYRISDIARYTSDFTPPQRIL